LSMRVMIMYFNFIIVALVEQISNVSVLSPLVQAAKGQMVALNELKFALKRAIQIVLSRLDPNESVAKVLNTAKFALEERKQSGAGMSAANSDVVSK